MGRGGSEGGGQESWLLFHDSCRQPRCFFSALCTQARIQAQKRWHQEIEKKKKEHRSSKKARMTAWLKSNQEAKKMQETRLGAD